MINLLEYLEECAARFPDKIAYSDEQGFITYAGLLEKAKAIGSAVAEKIAVKNRPVGVMADRSCLTLAAFFGVLYSGNFYAPLDPDMPQARLRVLSEKLQPALILFHGDGRLPEVLREYPSIDDTFCEKIDEERLSQRRNAHIDADPAYIIHTSGSTGVPKGIVVSHRAVIDFIEWMSKTIGYSSDDVFANQAPFYFDCSVKDIYLTLKHGATNHIIPKRLFAFPSLLIDFLNDKKVTALAWATSGFNLVSMSGILKKKKPEYLRCAAFGGETMLAKHLGNWMDALPETKFVNLYGPTETTVDCTYYIIDRRFAVSESIPIGYPCENKEILLLDDRMNLVPDGEVGEICVRGSGIANGYYADFEKTRSSFVQNPLVEYPDILYRTGDLGVRNPDGSITFRARRDGQIKHMGYRIELGETERAMSTVDGIEESVCLYDAEKDRIVCIYSGNAESSAIIARLREFLPKYMLPNRYMKKERLPHNANGKLDRPLIKKEYEEADH